MTRQASRPRRSTQAKPLLFFFYGLPPFIAHGASGCAQCPRHLTIVGGVRDASVVRRAGTQSTLRARRARLAWVPGPSTSPLEGANATQHRSASVGLNLYRVRPRSGLLPDRRCAGAPLYPKSVRLQSWLYILWGGRMAPSRSREFVLWCLGGTGFLHIAESPLNSRLATCAFSDRPLLSRNALSQCCTLVSLLDAPSNNRWRVP